MTPFRSGDTLPREARFFVAYWMSNVLYYAAFHITASASPPFYVRGNNWVVSTIAFPAVASLWYALAWPNKPKDLMCALFLFALTAFANLVWCVFVGLMYV